MAASLLIGVPVVSDRLMPSAGSLAARAAAAVGLTSALFYFAMACSAAPSAREIGQW